MSDKEAAPLPETIKHGVHVYLGDPMGPQVFPGDLEGYAHQAVWASGSNANEVSRNPGVPGPWYYEGK